VLAAQADDLDDVLGACARCGSPTTSDVCAFCRLVETAADHEPVPVELVLSGSARRAYQARAGGDA
jgi:hypothetical protein